MQCFLVLFPYLSAEWVEFKDPHQGFLSSALLEFGVEQFLAKEAYPVHCKMFSSTPAHSKPIAPASTCNNQKCLHTLPNVPLLGGRVDKLTPSGEPLLKVLPSHRREGT